MQQEAGGRRSRSQEQELQDPSLVVKASRRIQSATPPDAAISGLGAGLGRGTSTAPNSSQPTVRNCPPQERAPVLLAIFVLPVNAQGQPSRFSSHSKRDDTGELEGWIPRSGPGRPGCHPRGPQVHVSARPRALAVPDKVPTNSGKSRAGLQTQPLEPPAEATRACTLRRDTAAKVSDPRPGPARASVRPRQDLRELNRISEQDARASACLHISCMRLLHIFYIKTASTACQRHGLAGAPMTRTHRSPPFGPLLRSA